MSEFIKLCSQQKLNQEKHVQQWLENQLKAPLADKITPINSQPCA